jgi:putative redox protein
LDFGGENANEIGKDLKMIKASVRWAGNKQFIGIGENSGHAIVMDMAKDKGGENTGMRMTELFLISIAGCTAIDMHNILTRMKIQLTRCEVQIQGRQMESYPKYFHRFQVKYTLSGEGLELKKAEKAVALSMDKYCAVSQTVKDRAEFDIKIEIV